MRGPMIPMVNTDFSQSHDNDYDTTHRTFGLGYVTGTDTRVSIRREHR